MAPSPKYLLWCDLEATGSDRKDDPILEYAHLEAVVQPAGREWTQRMIPEVLEMHTVNGLLLDIFTSSQRVLHPALATLEGRLPSLAEVDSTVVGLLSKLGKPHDFMLAGSGVSHYDRGMIEAQMPKLHRFLRYNTHDVGVVRRFLESIGLDSLTEPSEGGKAHRAMADIEMHLAEARKYAEALRQVLLPGARARWVAGHFLAVGMRPGDLVAKGGAVGSDPSARHERIVEAGRSINEGQARIDQAREEAGVAPGEPLLGLDLPEGQVSS